MRKNLYIFPRSIASLTPAEVIECRARLGVKVRGKGAPAPVSKLSEAGLSERILSMLEKKGICNPFPVQAQCLPCIMAGRDVIGSVAGWGLDVPSCGCVVNYANPNHLEDYVHRVGRTGRANNRGVAYTFVNSTDKAKFAPIVVRALVEAGHSKNLSQELKDLSDSFKEKVAKGEARWASSGYQVKGYSYDSSELSDIQKLAQMDKRQFSVCSSRRAL